MAEVVLKVGLEEARGWWRLEEGHPWVPSVQTLLKQKTDAGTAMVTAHNIFKKGNKKFNPGCIHIKKQFIIKKRRYIGISST